MSLRSDGLQRLVVVNSGSSGARRATVESSSLLIPDKGLLAKNVARERLRSLPIEMGFGEPPVHLSGHRDASYW